MEFKKGMKVRYIGEDCVAFETGKIYEVQDIDDELGWPELGSSGLDDEAFILPPEVLEIVTESPFVYWVEAGDQPIKSKLVARMNTQTGATEKYNFVKRIWEEDYVNVPKVFLGKIEVDTLSEEEINKMIGL